MENIQMLSVSRTYIQSVVPDRIALYTALVRNQYFVPLSKDNLMSVEFMRGIVDNTFWMPKACEIRLMNCADPPSKHELVRLLVEAMYGYPSQGVTFDTSFHRTIIKIKARPPCLTWMLAILSTIQSNHPIFAKDYIKPKPMKQGIVQGQVPDPHSFFTGLPV